MYKTYEYDLAGRKLVIEIGRVAELAGGAALVKYQDTVVLVSATASEKPRAGIDFFPLSIDYEERLYAVGKIPGGFIKREGRPTERAILTSRVIDRPIRPLFPKDYRNDVAVVATVLSVDQDASPEVAAMLGASVALSISDIPFMGPTAAVNVGLTDGGFVLNPTEAQREVSEMTLTVASTRERVMMIEAGAAEVPDEVMFDAIMFAHEENKRLVAFIDGIVADCGKPKRPYEEHAVNAELYGKIKEFAGAARMEEAVFTDMKQERDERLRQLSAEITEKFAAEFAENPDFESEVGEALYKFEKETVRRMILRESKRPDGRRLDQIRPLSAEIDVLPRSHGSAMFKRGQTQVLTITTLGSLRDVQILDGLDSLEESKRYMHHYNFPSFSVGETKPSRGPGRREIGHGALAERALLPVIPPEEEFPYAIRLVSEVLSSNGSTSQGSVCASTLSLMAAGVPIKRPVAGISVGLVTGDGIDDFVLLTDIQGIEDFFGDMDFKVAGTKHGITAIQMDIKVDGLSPEIIRLALKQTHEARNYILDEVMLKAINEPRPEVSPYAPKMGIIAIDPEKIAEVIGPRGKVIKRIIEDTGVTSIDTNDDGRIFVGDCDQAKIDKALAIIRAIVTDPEVGAVFEGRVTRLLDFGAFVEIAPEKEGLVHISQLAAERIEKVEDAVKVGDYIKVVVCEIDGQGRINLSHKQLITGIPAPARGDRPDKRGGGRGGDRSDRGDRPRFRH
ncbi:MAG: polyribonucleotide nucleotidyltransferase [Clostridiales bacterium]|nr:polyribonucleotide nucleotidyltransferase [Clostridiales bacterium]